MKKEVIRFSVPVTVYYDRPRKKPLRQEVIDACKEAIWLGETSYEIEFCAAVHLDEPKKEIRTIGTVKKGKQ